MSNEATQQTNQTQDTRVVLNVVTEQKLEQALTEQWASFKTWVENNIDNSNLMGIVKATLDQANREVIGTTGTAKADAINASVVAIKDALEDAGVDMTGIKTNQFASIIANIVGNTGVFILDTNGVRWTATEWSLAPSGTTVQGILLTTVRDNLLISHLPLPECTNIDEVKQWGTYSQAVTPMNTFTALNAEPYSGLMDTLHLMCWANPDVMIAQTNNYTMQGSASMTYEQVLNKELIYFTDPGALDSILKPWATSIGTAQMANLRNKNFAIPTSSAMTTWNVYCYTGTTSIAFTVRSGSVPKTDSQGILGAPAARSCFKYKAYTGDTKQWWMPSVYELFLMYLNKAEIDACMTAVGSEQLKVDVQYWSSVQNSTNFAYYVPLSSGVVNSYNKGSNCRVRAVTRV